MKTLTQIINWKTTKRESALITKIVDRAMAFNKPEELMDCRMDITAAHLNGCKLDLEKLLNADEFNFAHDVMGIRRHINRETGKLMNCFRPRCSAT